MHRCSRLGGSPIGLLTIVRTLLFLSIVYAVIRYSIAERRRQAGMEQEIQNARELQQILVPETRAVAYRDLRLTSAYSPAQEVGGDFFQIIPLEPFGGSDLGSTLVVLGDVSGKGLKAAMTVSLIVGAIRSRAETTASPAEILGGPESASATAGCMEASPPAWRCAWTPDGRLHDRERGPSGTLSQSPVKLRCRARCRLGIHRRTVLQGIGARQLQARRPSRSLGGLGLISFVGKKRFALCRRNHSRR